MRFAVAVARLHIPAATSLKQKRRVLRAVMDRIHHRFRVSIAETDFHDLHQRAEIGLAVVHRSDRELERLLDEVRRMIDAVPDASLVEWLPQFFEEAS